jgi:Tfp pilus assembly protein PilE
MIVIAIVAILVALAVPAYKDYTVRTKVAECINGAAVPKLSISEYYESENVWPANANEAGTVAPAGESRYCDGFTYEDGTGNFDILVDEGAVGSNATIQPEMRPTANAQGGVDWACSKGQTDDAALKYVPASCRKTG